MALDDKTELHGQLTDEFPCLEVIAGPHAGTRFPLPMGKTAIGRAAENEVVLDDSSVSRKHASIERTPNTMILSDVGSRNGTKVGGERITAPYPLVHESRFKIGLYEFRLLTAEASPATPSDVLEGKSAEISSPKVEVPSFSARKIQASGREEKPFDGAQGKPDSGKPEEKKKEEVAEEGGEDDRLSHLPEGEFVEEGGGGEGSPPGVRRRRFVMLGGLVVALLVVGYFGKDPLVKMVKKGSKTEATRGKKLSKKIEKRKVAEETPPPEEGEVPPLEETPVVTETSRPPPPPVVEEERPVFLDFSSSPLPAEVYFGAQLIGTTPLRSNTKLKIGKWYEAKGVFRLTELGETLEEKAEFSFPEGANIIPIHFAGKMGVFKVSALPKESQLYLEGYFEKDPYRPKPIKFAEIVYGKPVYVPFGRYIVELRKSRQLGTSQTFLDEVVYHREFFIKEDQSHYAVEVRDEDLASFPIQIASQPIGARVFIDDKEVGTTPYSGSFPVGEHVLTLKRDGYFDYAQLVKVALNTLYTTEIQLKTTEAGELINKAVDLMKEDRHAEALPVLVEAYSKNPSARETAQISYFVGLCYLKQKMYPEATSYFLKAGDHPDFVSSSKLGLASVAQEQGDSAHALPLLVEVLLLTTDTKIRADAGLLFQKVSPLKSVVYVTSDPVGGNVFVNGVDVKQVTPLILHDLGLGNYRIEVKKDGFQVSESKLNLGASEFQPVVVKLTPIAK